MRETNIFDEIFQEIIISSFRDAILCIMDICLATLGVVFLLKMAGSMIRRCISAGRWVAADASKIWAIQEALQISIKLKAYIMKLLCYRAIHHQALTGHEIYWNVIDLRSGLSHMLFGSLNNITQKIVSIVWSGGAEIERTWRQWRATRRRFHRVITREELLFHFDMMLE